MLWKCLGTPGCLGNAQAREDWDTVIYFSLIYVTYCLVVLQFILCRPIGLMVK